MINKSWFKLELYTATPCECTEYFKVSIQKITKLNNLGRRLVLSDRFNFGTRLDIPEGTTRYINIDCYNPNGTVFDLEGYTVAVRILFDGNIIEKVASILDNTISFTIDPEDTIDKKSGEYEVRIYKNDDIYQVIKGDIGIRSSIRPFLYANEEV